MKYFLLLVATLLSIQLVAPVNTTYAAAKDPSFRGQNGYGLSFGGGWTGADETQTEELLNATDDVGAGWVRLDVFWAYMQPNNSSDTSWADTDNAIAAAKAHNKRVLLLVHTTPEWARPVGAPSGSAGDKYAPTDTNDYASFFSKVVKRYSKQGIKDYEIWNEPNISAFWKDTVANPNPNPIRYTELLKRAATAGRAVDSSINIVTAGLSPAGDSPSSVAPRTFLNSIYSNGGKSSFNAVGMHPYSYPFLPSHDREWNAWQQMNKTSFDNGNITQDSLRSIMITNGDSAKKIWITEYGAPTSGNPDSVTETEQQAILEEAINLHGSYDWVGPMFIFTMFDFQPYGSSADREDYFGIKHSDGSNKLAYASLKNLIKDTTLPNIDSSGIEKTKRGIRLRVTPSDNVGVTRIELLIDNKIIRNIDSSYLGYFIKYADYASGSRHTYQINAFDAAGNTASTSKFQFDVPQPASANGTELKPPNTGFRSSQGFSYTLVSLIVASLLMLIASVRYMRRSRHT